MDWVVSSANLGIVFAASGQAERAISQGERVVAKAREMRSLTSESVACINLGNILVLSGQPARAAEVLRVAADKAEQAHDRIYAYLAHGFGIWAEARQNHHEAALANIARTRAILTEMGRRLFYADWFDAYALEAAQRAGRLEEVLEEAPRVATHLQTAGNLFAEGFVQRAWGLALAARAGEAASLDDALFHLQEGVRLFQTSEAHVEAARTRLSLALLHRRRGDTAAADLENRSCHRHPGSHRRRRGDRRRAGQWVELPGG